MRDRRIDLLPKWAQTYISSLEKSLERAEKIQVELAEGDTDTFLEPYDKATPLPRGAVIRFKFGPDWEHHFDVWANEDKIEVMGGTVLSIEPRAANAVWIKTRDF